MSFESRSGKQQEIYSLKKQAMKYYKENNVPVEMENVLNIMFYEKPPDIYGYLVDYFSQFAKPATINKISASQVLDSDGQHTIQTDVWLTVNNLPVHSCSSTIPRADITLNLENPEKAELQIQASVVAAITFVNNELSNIFSGMDPLAQEMIDSEILSFIALKIQDEESKQIGELDDISLIDIKQKSSASRGKFYNTAAVKEIKGGKDSLTLSAVPDKLLEDFLVGCEVVAAISQAACACAARSRNIPIYQHIATLTHNAEFSNEFRIPIPMVTIIQSGRSVPGKVICIKEFMIIPGTEVPVDRGIEHIQHIFQHVSKFLAAKQVPPSKLMLVNQAGALCPHLESINQALDILLEAVNALGLIIGEDVHLAINGAGKESFDRDRGKYEVLAGQYKSPDDMVDFWCDLIKKYPSIVAVIDPVRGEDIDQWQSLCERISENVLVIGDSFFERPGILREMKLPTHTSGIVMHIERMNTITDIIACAKKYHDLNNELVISTNNGDTTDTFIVDLAVGLNARFLKVGGPCRGEKTSKLNRLLQILKEMAPPIETEQLGNKTENDKTNGSDDAKFNVEMSSMTSESTYDKKEQINDKTQRKCVKYFLKPHASFIFPVIKKSQPETEASI